MPIFQLYGGRSWSDKVVRPQGVIFSFTRNSTKTLSSISSFKSLPTMASTSSALAQWSRASLNTPFRPRTQWICQPCFQQLRSATTGTSANAAKYRRNKEQAVAAKKKKQRNTFIYHNLKDAEQFALCDAMRYVWSLIFDFHTNFLFEGQS